MEISNIFRPYDIRGIYPEEINEDIVEKITKAFVYLYPDLKKIVIASDSRLSSPSLLEKAKEVLISAGKDVYDLGIAPDGVYFFSIFNYKFDAGIMITASHNPKNYNGMSFYTYTDKTKTIGQDIIGEELQEIGKMALNKDIDKLFEEKYHTDIDTDTYGHYTDIGKEFNAFEDYVNFVAKKIKPQRELKVIVDSSNGACGFLPEKIFQKLGFHVETLNGDFDGNFPAHIPDPYKEDNLEQIKQAVINKKADLGFCFDTDGDRVAVINNNGKVVSGDDCLYFLALDVLEKQKGPIVHDVRVSKAFLDAIDKNGVESYFSISHHSAIAKKIDETKAVFGGEITLHFLFPLDYYLCDDAIFASLKIAEIASEQRDFVKFINTIPHYFTSPEIFLSAEDETKYQKIEDLKKFLRGNNYHFIDVDGARINLKKGWALVRASNTEPIIKLRFEGETEQDLKEIGSKIRSILKEVGIPADF